MILYHVHDQAQPFQSRSVIDGTRGAEYHPFLLPGHLEIAEGFGNDIHPFITAECKRGELAADLRSGHVPPEIWNRLGTKVLPKLRSGSELKIGIDFSVTVDGQLAFSFESDIQQILEDLGLTGRVKIE